ncbi:hypothetical protein [Bacillus taeanensis]|uniref:Uncharacterized protein n=1 Tax=Bacillus taeanensis TaxID=273032 RepID=A0A366Y352_9BACI|nr:hypothetical protein [Bacillus taeanensis]RBW70814.1 hypothetical protein DS031_04910 [Bacillus taeanensis]
MYIKRTLKVDQLTNNDKAAKFKFIDDRNDCSLNINIVGVIGNVGVDFVDLIKDDHTVVTILTERIKKIKWIDNNCRRFCSRCRGFDCSCFDCHDDCRKGCRKVCRCEEKKDHHSKKRCTCFFDHVIPFCDERIELRLAGLTDSVNFELFRHIGCKVKLELC